MSEYKSLDRDGTPMRLLNEPKPCEWCGFPIPPGNLVIQRHYQYEGIVRATVQHLSCYQKTFEYCLKYGHTFTPYYMEPRTHLKIKNALMRLKANEDTYVYS